MTQIHYNNPVEVISTVTNMPGYVRIHYVGYSSTFDEWRPRNDHVTTVPIELSSSNEDYNFNRELALKLKSSLVSQRRSNPAVKIEMSFDKKHLMRD